MHATNTDSNINDGLTSGPPATHLLLFGPQLTRLTGSHLTDLRTTILSDPNLDFLVQAIRDLPSQWETTVKTACPSLAALASSSRGDLKGEGEGGGVSQTLIQQRLQQLAEFFDDDNNGGATLLSSAEPPNNAILAPLTGFCIGFLTATAVSSAAGENNRVELARLVGIAVRLAVCVGAVIDLGEQEQGLNAAYSVRWSEEGGKKCLEETLGVVSDAYVSCVTDIDRVTITLPQRRLAEFSQRLSDGGGPILQPVGLYGRYHEARPDREALVRELKDLCRENEAFRFPTAESLVLPLRSTASVDGHRVISQGALSDMAIDNILTQKCEWFETVRAAVGNRPVNMIPIGGPGAVPRSLVPGNAAGDKSTLSKSTLSRQSTVVNGINGINGISIPRPLSETEPPFRSEAIAVIGMACRYPQAPSLSEFWRLITSGRNAVGPVPPSRFRAEELWREPKGPFWGNFVQDPEAFDHRFFQVSAREAASMDPQQRLILQVAYEAIESAGYAGSGRGVQQRVGCYMGVGSVDYEANVASDNATAFSATGTLRAFISGKVSHHFGWTGPSVTFDTACSSSAVAIHHAVKALQTKECPVAIAGGVNLITSPSLYQNLAAASFLSPTGASRAFDAQGDGYCRGEGAGVIVLKPLAQALADGDVILGTILGTAVNQGSNCSPITVPDSAAQSELYSQALASGGVAPSDVTYVEAHGTGTPVGDPIECASIRSALGGAHRQQEVTIGSVKDVIGHTEAASGVAGCIKTLLMMQHGAIPKQPNFSRLNPKIPPLGPDKLAIATQRRPWEIVGGGKRTALVNNYGAAGSNAAILLQEYRSESADLSTDVDTNDTIEYPLAIAAKTPESVRTYAAALKSYLDRQLTIPAGISTKTQPSLKDISFHLARRLNLTPSFQHIATWTSSTLPGLSQDLDALASGTRPVALSHTSQTSRADPKSTSSNPPIILTFGGQTGRTIHLSPSLVSHSPTLHTHLTHCDTACRTLGLPPLIPRIFDPSPFDTNTNNNSTNNGGLVSLHAALFSIQYATARTWIDAGVRPAALLGHSFGQLTALCVAGVLGVEDGLRLVTGRAGLIEDGGLWGVDSGAMLAVEGVDRGFDLDRLLAGVPEGDKLDVACWNGPRSVVLAGETAAVDAVERVLRGSSSGSVRVSRLSNSHAYHSRLADPILDRLRALAASLTWRSPIIPIEMCSPGSKSSSWAVVGEPITVEDAANQIASHTRDTVHFAAAVERIAQRYPTGCVWLEAGSASPVVAMARRALPTTTGHVFLPLDLGSSSNNNPWPGLARTVTSLWTAGTAATFWTFHHQQHPWVDLPPYQFAKTKHWIDFEAPARRGAVDTQKTPESESSGPQELVRLVQHRKADGGEALFAVDASHDDFIACVSGHAVLGQSLCPASMYFELVIRAARSFQPSPDKTVPRLENLRILSPLALKPDGRLYLSLIPVTTSTTTWNFSLFSSSSSSSSGPPTPSSPRTIHAQGTVSFLEADSTAVASRFRFLGRLMGGSSRNEQIALSPGADRLSGDIIYRVFGRIVNYAPHYQGVRDIVACNGEVVGDVVMPGSQSPSQSPRGVPLDVPLVGVSNPLAVDNFLQVAGIHVNCLTGDRADDDVFVCTAIGEVLWSETFMNGPNDSDIGKSSNSATSSIGAGGPWKVYSNLDAKRKNKNTVANDILVLDPVSGDVVLAILDAEFTRVSMSSLYRALSKLNGNGTSASRSLPTPPPEEEVKGATYSTYPHDLPNGTPPQVPPSESVDEVKKPRLLDALRNLLSEVLGAELAEIQPTSSLEDLGVDSLMITELAGELKKHFSVDIPLSQLQELTDVQSLSRCLELQVGGHESKESVGLATPETTGLDTPPPVTNGVNGVVRHEEAPTGNFGGSAVADAASEWLASHRDTYDTVVQESQLQRFRQDVYPHQAQLVVAYVIEALARLGCDLRTLQPGDALPAVQHLPRHEKVMGQIYRILDDAGLVNVDGGGTRRRTSQPAPLAASSGLHSKILQQFPQHVSEHSLLHTTGSRLADCLSGHADPISLLFGNPEARRLLGDVYTNAPMFKAGTLFLARFLAQTLTQHLRDSGNAHNEIRILELGAGTGGTTSHLLEHLTASGLGGQQHNLRYTFTDLSSSLVTAAKKKFARYPFMEYAVLDIEQTPPPHLLGQFDIIISTNCIHATRDLTRSCTHIRRMLREGGLLFLVELTQNLFWFDLVFGLLEGWWLFEDGRSHALASEERWRGVLLESGFEWVDWSDGRSAEASILRLIVASTSASSRSHPALPVSLPSPPQQQETVVFKHAGPLALHADIYYPPTLDPPGSKPRPVALMIHGGGHILLSRSDIRPKQTSLLLTAGFLPISIDYRLCPETTLLQGPMTDVLDALAWARHTLPYSDKSPRQHRPDVRIDGTRLVAVGWSTGGMLALSLGWTAPRAGLAAPEAVLGFYCPSDYQDECWGRPNLPFNEKIDEGGPGRQGEELDVWEGVKDAPIVGYNPPASALAKGGWMARGDARSRIALWMNWRGKTVEVLVHGLRKPQQLSKEDGETKKGKPILPTPTPEQVAAISPLAQIRLGNYETPTFLVHPVDDDLIPWQQAQRTVEELQARGVQAEVRIVDKAVHLFDLYPRYDRHPGAVAAIKDGYEFLKRAVGL
ncbi:polyketide synthase [Chaetomium sp. MPI-SDFR-AT-0129]|nr:polyketide synthase [Chaetomium sp. MPI-SDFR-AT-0129]